METEGKEQAIVADTAGTRSIRMAQISAGFYKTDDGKEESFKDNPKLDFVKEVLETTDQKVLVWARFRKDIKTLLIELAKYNPASIWGDTGDMAEKFAEAERFNNEPTCKVIVLNPQSASTAINLIAGSIAIYYSQDHNWQQFEQSKARNCRKGSEIHEKITYYYLVYPKSIDEIVYENLKCKGSTADALTSKALWVNLLR